MNTWTPMTEAMPPDGEVVDTYVNDVSSTALLVLHRTLWWHADMRVMSVEEPTHWRAAQPLPEFLGAFRPLSRMLTVPDRGVIVVAGAWRGDYLHWLSQQFPTARLYGFEPQPDAFNEAKQKLQGVAVLQNHGLATATRIALIGNYGTDGCSISATDNLRSVRMMDAVQALSVIGSTIHLLILNCEGSEWALLPYLLNEMMHNHIRTIAVQFHPHCVSETRANHVLDMLLEYYEPIHFDYPSWCLYTRRI